MTHRPGVSKTIGMLIVAAMIVIIVLVAVMQTGVRPADESHRMRHPIGFSIIMPEGWEQQTLFPSQSNPTWTLWGLPSKPEGRVGGLYAGRHVFKPKITTTGKTPMHEGQFQGQPAWVFEDTQHPKSWTRTYIFEREGNWYQVTLTRPASEDIMGPAWTSYLESFRLEKPIGSAGPTSYPTTAPHEFPSSLPAMTKPGNSPADGLP